MNSSTFLHAFNFISIKFYNFNMTCHDSALATELFISLNRWLIDSHSYVLLAASGYPNIGQIINSHVRYQFNYYPPQL